ncbi:hypothetical protein IHE45_08G160400 [Dioscorea alata]|uniref:Uncharacterized protein n=1 Tax=Dioscorea alata TaxID=55571 RepID=A0ACB7VP13_DIOAL|nr:hypothetical protein IHE45_08G160400 [Dioscorea alata]
MKLANKACIALSSVGAALELKEQLVKPKPSAMKHNWAAIGSPRWWSPTSDHAMESKGPSENNSKTKCMAAEESMRMVMYLSSWGPS